LFGCLIARLSKRQLGRGIQNLQQHFEGLANGSVYQRHPDYQDPSNARIAVLNLLKPEMRIDGFIKSKLSNKLNAMALTESKS